MVIAMCPVQASAAVTCSGTYGDNLTWPYTAGALTISGTGAITDYSGSNIAPWKIGVGEITSLVIGSGVTSIGIDTFAGLSISSVSIPSGVTSIGNGAFQGCTKLTSVTIPGNVTKIGTYAFYNCSALASVSIESGVRTIDASAFSYTPITGVTIPASVTSLDSTAFEGCSSLKKISVASGNANYSSDSTGVLFN